MKRREIKFFTSNQGHDAHQQAGEILRKFRDSHFSQSDQEEILAWVLYQTMMPLGDKSIQELDRFLAKLKEDVLMTAHRLDELDNLI